MAAVEVAAWVLDRPGELVVITGGEPLLQQRRLVPVLEQVVGEGRRVEVETNGTVVPLPAVSGLVTRFNVSPKLSVFAAGADSDRRISPAGLEAFMATGRAVFKFVVSSVADLDEIAVLERGFGLAPIWVMPEARSCEDVIEGMRSLSDEVVSRGWNLSGRLQVLLWGDVRGR